MKKNLLKLMALGVFAVSTAVAQVPATFNFQGRLTDAKNNPITTTVDVTFEIFDVPNGGTPLHTEVMTITPDNGYFNVRIGRFMNFQANVETITEQTQLFQNIAIILLAVAIALFIISIVIFIVFKIPHSFRVLTGMGMNKEMSRAAAGERKRQKTTAYC